MDVRSDPGDRVINLPPPPGWGENPVLLALMRTNPLESSAVHIVVRLGLEDSEIVAVYAYGDAADLDAEKRNAHPGQWPGTGYVVEKWVVL